MMLSATTRLLGYLMLINAMILFELLPLLWLLSLIVVFSSATIAVEAQWLRQRLTDKKDFPTPLCDGDGDAAKRHSSAA
jgi:hypothetical protein